MILVLKLKSFALCWLRLCYDFMLQIYKLYYAKFFSFKSYD